MIIRGMKESDIMPLYALEEQCFCLSDRWSMADIRKAYELEHFFVLVAEEAEEICGYCIVYAVMDSADIGKIAVAPKARGKGIAGNLLEHLWKVCAERGIKDVILEVRVAMMLRGACIQSMDSRRFPCGRIIIKSLWNMD